MEVELTQKPDTENKKEFNPNKKYQWKNDTVFPFVGAEFGMLHKNILEFLSYPISPASILKVSQVYELIQQKIKESVENGHTTEVEETNQPQQ